jgi:hypothetical protein
MVPPSTVPLEPLQHLGQNEIAKTNVAPFQGFVQEVRLERVDAVEVVDPHTRVDQDHLLDL